MIVFGWHAREFREIDRLPQKNPGIDRMIAAGVRFGCVLGDAGHGLSAPFRQALPRRLADSIAATNATGSPRAAAGSGVFPRGRRCRVTTRRWRSLPPNGRDQPEAAEDEDPKAG